MPIHQCEENLVIEMGSGDVGVYHKAKIGSQPVILFQNEANPQQVGDTIPGDPNREPSGFFAALSFSNADSVDVVIDALMSFKREQFPTCV